MRCAIAENTGRARRFVLIAVDKQRNKPCRSQQGHSHRNCLRVAIAIWRRSSAGLIGFDNATWALMNTHKSVAGSGRLPIISMSGVIRWWALRRDTPRDIYATVASAGCLSDIQRSSCSDEVRRGPLHFQTRGFGRLLATATHPVRRNLLWTPARTGLFTRQHPSFPRDKWARLHIKSKYLREGYRLPGVGSIAEPMRFGLLKARKSHLPDSCDIASCNTTSSTVG